MTGERRRLRDVVWFESLADYGVLKVDVPLLRFIPYGYLVSFVLFPLAVALAVIGPWGTPVWPWGVLVMIAEGGPLWMIPDECKKQGRSERGFYAMRAWFWLRCGGAVPQAVRTIVVNRRVMRDPLAFATWQLLTRSPVVCRGVASGSLRSRWWLPWSPGPPGGGPMRRCWMTG